MPRQYQKTNQFKLCAEHCEKYLQTYRELGTYLFFVQVGGILADIRTEKAEALANCAYDKAESLLLTPKPVVHNKELLGQ